MRRGENIYKRKDGRWEGRYIEGYNAEGKAVYRSVYARTYSDVKLKLKAHPGRRMNVCADITVAGWVMNYICSIKEKVKITTYAIYERYAANHIEPFFKAVPLQRLDRKLLQDFVDSEPQLAPSTVKGIFVLLRESLKEAHKQHLIENVWDDIELPKERRSCINVFTKEEQRRIEGNLDIYANPNEIGILICLYTGLRLGEVCGLQWNDIDFVSGYVTVARTVQRLKIDDKYVLLELPPKSDSSQRRIPLPAFLLERLSALHSCSECRYVLNTDSKMMDPRTYQYQYKRILERCGVRYANFHILRHTFSVRALENGFDIKTLSEILGHADASITMKRYAHSLDDHKRSSMEKLGAIYK